MLFSIEQKTLGRVKSQMRKLLIGLSSLVIFLNLLQAKTVVVVGSGSGVFIAENTILTANHVVRLADKVKIGIDGEETIGNVVKRYVTLDMALIEVEGKHKYAKLRLNPKLGERVYIVSAPGGHYEDVVLFGRVAAITAKWLLVDAKVIAGSSGGAIFDTRGRLLGIVKSGYGSTRMGDWLLTAIPAKTIKQFLEE